MRSPQRTALYADIIVMLVENFGALPYFAIDDYHHEAAETTTATLIDTDDDKHVVTPATVARGFNIIRNARIADPEDGDDGPVLHDAKTGKRLFLSQPDRAAYLKVLRDPDLLGQLDCVDASNIIEIGIYGAVTY